MDTFKEWHEELTLYNFNKHFGITLSGGVEYNLPLYITKVKKDSNASRFGLAKRDIILSINGYNCIRCNHRLAVKLITSSRDYVTLCVYRTNLKQMEMCALIRSLEDYVHRHELDLGPNCDDIEEMSLQPYPIFDEESTNPSMANGERGDSFKQIETPCENKKMVSNSSSRTKPNGEMKNEEMPTDRISCNTFGPDWYKSYASSTVKAKKNVTVKELMKLERRKSLQGRSHLKSPTKRIAPSGTNFSSNNSVESIVRLFNGHLGNGRVPSPNSSPEPSRGRSSKQEEISDGDVSVERFLENPLRFLISYKRATYPLEKNSIYEAVVISDYHGGGSCEISVRKGTRVILLRSIDKNWYEGFSIFSDFKIIPKHIVKIVRIVFLNKDMDVQIPQSEISNTSN